MVEFEATVVPLDFSHIVNEDPFAISMEIVHQNFMEMLNEQQRFLDEYCWKPDEIVCSTFSKFATLSGCRGYICLFGKHADPIYLMISRIVAAYLVNVRTQ